MNTISPTITRYYALMGPNSGYKKLDLEVVTQTDKAILFKTSFTDGIWIPKSQLEVLNFAEGKKVYFATHWILEQNSIKL